MTDLYTFKSTADVQYDEEPHGWIQWKGTNVCMDVRCSCGALTHLDADFAYFVECGACHARYAVGCNVKLIALPAEYHGEVDETLGFKVSDYDQSDGDE